MKRFISSWGKRHSLEEKAVREKSAPADMLWGPPAQTVSQEGFAGMSAEGEEDSITARPPSLV